MDLLYYMAVETKPNNYFPVDFRTINISHNNPTKLQEIDVLTMNLSSKEIINAIKEANIIEILDTSKLVIVFEEKNRLRTIPVLFKENSFDMWKYLKDNYSKNLINKIYNFLYNKLDEDTCLAIKNSKDINELIFIVGNMPYNITRKLYFYLNEK